MWDLLNPIAHKKVYINPKQMIAYLLTISACVAIFYAFDRKLGVIFLAALIIAPTISLVMLKSSRIAVTLSLSSDTAYKGETVEIIVKIESLGGNSRRLEITRI